MFLTAKNFGLQEETLHRQTAGKDHELGKRDGVPQKEKRDRGTEREREKEGGKMQCFMKNEDKSLIDVENVETTGERCCHLS